MPRLDGKIALITGAGSGIGAACALRFAAEGCTVVGFDLTTDGNDDWQQACRTQSACRMIRGDISDEHAIAAAVNDVAKQHKRIDILVNSAGVGSGMPLHLLETEEFDRVLDINLKGTFLACRETLKVMLAQRSGSIINLASVEGVTASEVMGAYNASKAGVILLTKNIAVDYGRIGIRANSICPGFIESPMTDAIEDASLRNNICKAHMIERMGTPAEVANAALFLASDEASFVSGSEIFVDGGFNAGKRFGINEAWDLGLA